MDVSKVVKEVLKKNEGNLKEIYFVACGGSLVDMYVADYFVKSEATKLVSGWYTANEFVHATPKKLGSSSVVILCSHGGNTPETVKAGEVAQKLGAQTIGLSHNKKAELLNVSDFTFLYEWGDETNVKNNPMAIILDLTVSLFNAVEQYEHYADFRDGVEKINTVISKAKKQVANRVKVFANKYGKEELFYILGSGPSFGHAYGFSICSLMEMQWLDAAAIHSGEYFHGPFEVTDKETPFILLMSEGRTRALDERAKVFLDQYAEKVEVVDSKELGLDTISDTVSEFFNPILFYSVLSEYREALAEIRQHPLDTRRYMGKVPY